MGRFAQILVVLGVVSLSACASGSKFTTTWTAPDATPLGFKSQKVAAAVLLDDLSKRKLAEDRLAMHISMQGAQGRALHSLLPNVDFNNQAQVRAGLESQGVKGIVVMKPIHVDREVTVTPGYESQGYASLWGGSYGTGVSLGYTSGRPTTVTEDTVVYVETLVYSLDQNKLVWGGLSKSEDPDTIAEIIEQISAAVGMELRKAGLIQAK